MEFNVRKAEISDLDFIFNSIFSEAQKGFYTSDIVKDPIFAKKYFEYFLLHKKDLNSGKFGEISIAENKGDAIGYFLKGKNQKNGLVELGAFGILPKFRGNGLGGSLLDFFLAQNSRASKIRAYCFINNKAFGQMLQKRGFELIDVKADPQCFIKRGRTCGVDITSTLNSRTMYI